MQTGKDSVQYKKKPGRVMEDRWRERWSDERRPMSRSCGRWMAGVWVELSLVWCWLCVRWCSAGQMVLVGRWVNNDVSPQCSNYLLPGPCGSLHPCTWRLARTRSCMSSWIFTYIHSGRTSAKAHKYQHIQFLPASGLIESRVWNTLRCT